MTDGNAVMYDDNGNGKDLIGDPTLSGLTYVPQDGFHKKLSEFRHQIDLIILCNPDPKVMADAIQNDVYVPSVQFDNVASAYAGLFQVEPDTYNSLVNSLKSINPNFTKIRLSVEQYAKYLIFDYKYKDIVCSYKLSDLSDGERMLFALYMLLYGYIKRGYTVLLDEPDNYISLKEIQPWCMDLEDVIEESGQCLIISHHPEIIDYMAENRGKWVARLGSGETTIAEEMPFGENKDLLTCSQMIARGYLDEIK